MGGFFVVVEGVDSSGKRTQVGLLASRLKKDGYRTDVISFPRYDTEYGKLVTRYLHGEFGPKERLAPEIPSMLYAMDRYGFRDDLIQKLKTLDVVIADRYAQSNLGFQGAKFAGAGREGFVKWLEELDSRMPKPDMVIFLDVDPEIAAPLMKRRQEEEGRKKDMHESDIGYQKKVREVYLDVAAKEKWRVISCMGRDGIRPVEEISNDVYSAVRQRLK